MDRKLELMKTSEAAKVMGLKVDTLRGWARDGHVRPYRTPGGHYLWTVEMILEVLEREED